MQPRRHEDHEEILFKEDLSQGDLRVLRDFVVAFAQVVAANCPAIFVMNDL